jgi:DNA-binding XRE family transcriptional regulator
MGYNHWAAIREEFENREDEQLLADWEEAVRQDQIDPRSLSRVCFYDAFRSGRYMEERRAKELARRASNRSTVRGAKPAPVTIDPSPFPTGRALAAERVRARLRQRDLADAANMTRDSIARIEREAKRMTFEEACRLADALRVPLDRFRPG